MFTRQIPLVAALVCMLFVAPASAQSAGPGTPITVTEADVQHTLVLTVGQEVTVLLASTPSKSRYVTTGPTGKTPVVYLGESYTPSVLGQLGPGGQQRFRFRATTPGQTVLRFSLLNRRSVPLKSLRYAVTVTAAPQEGRTNTTPGAGGMNRGLPGRPVQLTLARSGQTVEVAVGSGVSLSLAGGGRYGVPSVSGPELQRFGSAGGATGTAGQQIYAYRALAAGQVILTVPVLDAAGQTSQTLSFTIAVR